MNHSISHRLTLCAIATLALVGSSCSSNGDTAAEANRPVVTAVSADDSSDETGSEVDDAGELLGRTRVSIISDTATDEPFEFDTRDILTGEQISGLDLYADRPMIMAFMAPWCPVCNDEAPFLNDLAADETVKVVAVHSAATESEIVDFINEQEMGESGVIHLDDTNGALWTRFNVVSQPMFILVHEDGTLTSSTGGLGEHGIARAAELLAP